jgi:hypothetical protein
MMLRSLLCALALAACSTAPPPQLPAPDLPQRTGVDPLVAARAEGVRFLAYGEAPIFHLRFYEDRISFALEGSEALSFARPAPTYPRWNGEIYTTAHEGHQLEVRIIRRPCATQLGYHIVELTIDGRELTGCGRDV